VGATGERERERDMIQREQQELKNIIMKYNNKSTNEIMWHRSIAKNKFGIIYDEVVLIRFKLQRVW
jgi:hypothetical protein